MAHDIPLLRQSHALATQRAPDLASRFYDTLFAEHPEAKRLFRRNPRPEQQRLLTKRSGPCWTKRGARAAR